MIKKLFIFLLLFLSLLVSGYSADHYLTSCGNSVWTAGDTYYLNFTNPTITAGTSCFTGTIYDVEIIQLNEKIYVDVPSYMLFFNGRKYNSEFKNLNIEYLGVSGSNDIIFYNQVLGVGFEDNLVENSIFRNIGTLVLDGNTNIQSNSVFNNVFSSGEYFFRISGQYQQFNFTNVLSLSTIYFNNIVSGNCHSENLTILSQTGLATSNYCTTAGNRLITDGSSIIVDLNNDGIQDTHENISVYNVYEIQNEKFLALLNFDEGQGDGTYNFIPSEYLNSDVQTFYLNDETLNVPFTVTPPNQNDFLGDLNLGSISAIALNGDINCSLSNSIRCSLNDNAYAGIISNTYRGLIYTSSNTLINNMQFTKSGSNNAHVISNSNDNLRNSITLTNNFFWKITGVLTGGDTSSNEILKLKYNNINMYNNNFLMTGTNEVFELLSIEGTNYKSNKIYNNTFTNNVNTPTSDSVIFNSYCDAEFYNNNVGSDIVLENDGCNGFLDTAPYIGYEHTDGKIYYYYVSNYYEDYSACVDVDNDGFCDDDYDDGMGWSDKLALSSYPFDYTQHLFTAEDVVDNIAFNVTLINIVDNETIELVDGTETLLFEFEHDSDFNDLLCTFYIDGIEKDPLSAYLKNTVYNYSQVGGWTEKAYAYRVECVNEFRTISSDEYIFNIVFEVIVNGCTDSGANNYNVLATVDDGSCTYDEENDDNEIGGGIDEVGNLFTGEIDDIGGNVNNLFGIMATPFSYLIIIGMVFLGLVIIVVLFSIPLAIVGGKK